MSLGVHLELQVAVVSAGVCMDLLYIDQPLHRFTPPCRIHIPTSSYMPCTTIFQVFVDHGKCQDRGGARVIVTMVAAVAPTYTGLIRSAGLKALCPGGDQPGASELLGSGGRHSCDQANQSWCLVLEVRSRLCLTFSRFLKVWTFFRHLRMNFWTGHALAHLVRSLGFDAS